MEKLRNKFEKLYEKFVKKSPAFKRGIESFSASGQEKEHKEGHLLLEDAERYVQQIRYVLGQREEDIDRSDLKNKISEFKKIYETLNELSKPEWIQWLEALGFAVVVVLILRNSVFGLYHVPSGSAEPTLLVGDRVLGYKMSYSFGGKPKRYQLVMFDNPKFEYSHNKLHFLWQKYVGFGLPLFGLPCGPENFVKRVIAAPGDTVEGRVENDKPVIYLNGERLEEPYVNPYPLIAIGKRTGFIDLDKIGLLPIPGWLKLKPTEYPLFYTYVPDKEFSDQPYYNMSSEEVGLKPGTLRPWLLMPGTLSKDEFGRIVDKFGPIVIPESKYWVMGDSRLNSKDSRFWGLLDSKLIHGRASLILYSIDSEEPLWLFELIKNPVRFWTKSVRWRRIFKFLNFKHVKNNK